MIFSPRPISPLEISSPEFSPHDIFTTKFFSRVKFHIFKTPFQAFLPNEVPIVLHLSNQKHLDTILLLYFYDRSETDRVLFTNILEDLVGEATDGNDFQTLFSQELLDLNGQTTYSSNSKL